MMKQLLVVRSNFRWFKKRQIFYSRIGLKTRHDMCYLPYNFNVLFPILNMEKPPDHLTTKLFFESCINNISFNSLNKSTQFLADSTKLQNNYFSHKLGTLPINCMEMLQGIQMILQPSRLLKTGEFWYKDNWLNWYINWGEKFLSLFLVLFQQGFLAFLQEFQFWINFPCSKESDTLFATQIGPTEAIPTRGIKIQLAEPGQPVG